MRFWPRISIHLPLQINIEGLNALEGREHVSFRKTKDRDVVLRLSKLEIIKQRIWGGLARVESKHVRDCIGGQPPIPGVILSYCDQTIMIQISKEEWEKKVWVPSSKFIDYWFEDRKAMPPDWQSYSSRTYKADSIIEVVKLICKGCFNFEYGTGRRLILWQEQEINPSKWKNQHFI